MKSKYKMTVLIINRVTDAFGKFMNNHQGYVLNAIFLDIVGRYLCNALQNIQVTVFLLSKKPRKTHIATPSFRCRSDVMMRRCNDTRMIVYYVLYLLGYSSLYGYTKLHYFVYFQNKQLFYI